MENKEQTQQAPKPSYNPLMDNVNEKPYSVTNVSVSQDQLSYDIPEPVYQPQAIGGRQNPYETIREGMSGSFPEGATSKRDSSPVNPSLKDLPDSEKKEGAKYVAKMVMDIYEQAHVWINTTLPIHQKKLRKLQAEGQIDLSMPVSDASGGTVSAGDVINEFNNEVKDALTVDPKWKKETMPILEEVLSKRGAAMTAEQMLLFQFGKDIGIKTIQTIGIKKQQEEIIQLLVDLKERYEGSGGSGYMPQRPQATPQPEERTEQPYAYAQPTPDVNSDTFNFEDNETVMSQSVEQMRVPKTGKERSIAQRQKEKKWAADSEKQMSAYEIAKQQRMTGKRGRAKKSPADYVEAVDKDEIVDALILSETQSKETNTETENND